MTKFYLIFLCLHCPPS
uniref:Uncharacterized protein n=1 Tax=Rhizophora mucronata TaxID=61149 RepID=A0A2P2NE60_RHIMU